MQRKPWWNMTKEEKASDKQTGKNILVGVGVVFLILVLIGITSPSDDKASSTAKLAPTTPNAEAIAAKRAVEAANKIRADKIAVSSLIIKKVGQKYRYFMDVSNTNNEPLTAVVGVRLTNADGSYTSQAVGWELDNLEPRLHKTGQIELNTGPTGIHGASGMDRYSYSVQIGENKFDYSEAPLTNKYENTNLYGL